MSVYKKFATQLCNLVSTISNRFPDDKKLSLAKTGLETIKQHNTRKLSEFYITQIYFRKYGDKTVGNLLKERNTDFFLNETLLNDGEKKSVGKGMGVVSDTSNNTEMDEFIFNLRSHWRELSEEELNNIWIYFDVLNRLAEKIIQKSI